MVDVEESTRSHERNDADRTGIHRPVARTGEHTHALEDSCQKLRTDPLLQMTPTARALTAVGGPGQLPRADPVGDPLAKCRDLTVVEPRGLSLVAPRDRWLVDRRRGSPGRVDVLAIVTAGQASVASGHRSRTQEQDRRHVDGYRIVYSGGVGRGVLARGLVGVCVVRVVGAAFGGRHGVGWVRDGI